MIKNVKRQRRSERINADYARFSIALVGTFEKSLQLPSDELLARDETVVPANI